MEDFELHEDTVQMNVVRCMVTQENKEEDWRRTSIFHTFFKCGDKSCK